MLTKCTLISKQIMCDVVITNDDDRDSPDDTDNLVCPGDMLEYATIDGDQEARRSTVETIIEVAWRHGLS